jgi:hypothetical protein
MRGARASEPKVISVPLMSSEKNAVLAYSSKRSRRLMRAASIPDSAYKPPIPVTTPPAA